MTRDLEREIREARFLLSRASTPGLVKLLGAVPPATDWSRLLGALIRVELTGREFSSGLRGVRSFSASGA